MGKEVLVGGIRKKVNEKLIGEKCLEKVEIEKLVEFLKIEDSESDSFFNEARNSWLKYRSAECLLFYNFYRKGTIRSIMYTS